MNLSLREKMGNFMKLNLRSLFSSSVLTLSGINKIPEMSLKFPSIPFLSFLINSGGTESPIENSTKILPVIHTPPPIQMMVEPAVIQRPAELEPVTVDHATLSNAVSRKLLEEKKLSLVLDLDHTLLHSSPFKNLTSEEQDLILKKTDPKVVFRVDMSGEAFVTKLRPGLAQFLEEASKLYSLHVFTLGKSVYTSKMLELIDPGRVYFDCESRIFTRESCSGTSNRYYKKTLDLVVGEAEGILIVDDRESLWKEKDKANLVVIPPYHFFGNSDQHGAKDGRGKSQLVMGTDESETEGHLSSVLVFLKRIHEKFFDTQTSDHQLQGSQVFGDRDVRKLKIELCQELLNTESARTAEKKKKKKKWTTRCSLRRLPCFH